MFIEAFNQKPQFRQLKDPFYCSYWYNHILSIYVYILFTNNIDLPIALYLINCLRRLSLNLLPLFFIFFGSRRQMTCFDITRLSTNRLCGEQNECPRAVISFRRIDTTPSFELKSFDRTATYLSHKFYPFSTLTSKDIFIYGELPAAIDCTMVQNRLQE